MLIMKVIVGSGRKMSFALPNLLPKAESSSAYSVIRHTNQPHRQVKRLVSSEVLAVLERLHHNLLNWMILKRRRIQGL